MVGMTLFDPVLIQKRLARMLRINMRIDPASLLSTNVLNISVSRYWSVQVQKVCKCGTPSCLYATTTTTQRLPCSLMYVAIASECGMWCYLRSIHRVGMVSADKDTVIVYNQMSLPES